VSEQISVRFDHVRLDVSDIDVAATFYRSAIGLREVIRYDVDDRVILQLAPAGLPAGVELWQEKGLTPTPHETQHIAFSVSDVPALIERVRSLGYQVTTEPYQIGEETVAFVADPDNHIVEFNDFKGRGVAEAGQQP
jgi:catechol 2,3-dioxygenase-like lactoylglutathione lyase family enzyme